MNVCSTCYWRWRRSNKGRGAVFTLSSRVVVLAPKGPRTSDELYVCLYPGPSYCYIPAEPGMCLAVMPRWFYVAKTGRCEEFIYGGCGGNDNRFSSLRECAETCHAPMCSPVMCTLYCEYGFKTGEDGCPICSCRSARK